MSETQQREHAVVEAVLYAMRSGCFFPVPTPHASSTVEQWTQWGAMRNLHDAVAALTRVEREEPPPLPPAQET